MSCSQQVDRGLAAWNRRQLPVVKTNEIGEKAVSEGGSCAGTVRRVLGWLERSGSSGRAPSCESAAIWATNWAGDGRERRATGSGVVAQCWASDRRPEAWEQTEDEWLGRDGEELKLDKSELPSCCDLRLLATVSSSGGGARGSRTSRAVQIWLVFADRRPENSDRNGAGQVSGKLIARFSNCFPNDVLLIFSF